MPYPNLSVRAGTIGIEHGRRRLTSGLDSDLEKLADAAVADWPDIAFSGQLDSAIGDLYRLPHLRFPPSWSQEECDEYIARKTQTWTPLD